MTALLHELRHNPLLWLLVFVPAVFVGQTLRPEGSGRSAWFVGVLVLMVYLIFAMTLYLLPPRAQ